MKKYYVIVSHTEVWKKTESCLTYQGICLNFNNSRKVITNIEEAKKKYNKIITGTSIQGNLIYVDCKYLDEYETDKDIKDIDDLEELEPKVIDSETGVIPEEYQGLERM